MADNEYHYGESKQAEVRNPQRDRHSSSILDELNVERVGKKIQLLLDEKISVQELRITVANEDGTTSSQKHEISASTLALTYPSMNEEKKTALRGSERGRILAARTMKEIMSICKRGAGAKQRRLITRVAMIERNLEHHTVEKPSLMVAAVHEEFSHLQHDRVNNIKEKILTTHLSHPCAPASTYLLDAIIGYVQECLSSLDHISPPSTPTRANEQLPCVAVQTRTGSSPGPYFER